MQKDAGLNFTRPIERLSSGGRWFAAVLFGFKLFAVATVIVAVVWRMTLPAYHLTAKGDVDPWFSAAEDFVIAGSAMSALCFIAGSVVVIGGLIQLLKHSRRAGAWSIMFGGLALAIGIFLFFYARSTPYSQHHELFTANIRSLSQSNF